MIEFSAWPSDQPIEIIDAPARGSVDIDDRTAFAILDTINRGWSIAGNVKDATADISPQLLREIPRLIVEYLQAHIKDELAPMVEARVRSEGNRLRGRID